jgi:hypothetical protein
MNLEVSTLKVGELPFHIALTYLSDGTETFCLLFSKVSVTSFQVEVVTGL